MDEGERPMVFCERGWWRVEVLDPSMGEDEQSGGLAASRGGGGGGGMHASRATFRAAPNAMGILTSGSRLCQARRANWQRAQPFGRAALAVAVRVQFRRAGSRSFMLQTSLGVPASALRTEASLRS